MVIRKSTTHAYYPLPDKGPNLAGSNGRLRYMRGFLVVSPKPSGLTRQAKWQRRGGPLAVGSATTNGPLMTMRSRLWRSSRGGARAHSQTGAGLAPAFPAPEGVTIRP